MNAPQLDLVVRGGTIVTPGSREIADVGVRDGGIAQLGGTMAGLDEVDARGLLVLPGGRCSRFRTGRCARRSYWRMIVS